MTITDLCAGAAEVSWSRSIGEKARRPCTRNPPLSISGVGGVACARTPRFTSRGDNSPILLHDNDAIRVGGRGRGRQPLEQLGPPSPAPRYTLRRFEWRRRWERSRWCFSNACRIRCLCLISSLALSWTPYESISPDAFASLSSTPLSDAMWYSAAVRSFTCSIDDNEGCWD